MVRSSKTKMMCVFRQFSFEIIKFPSKIFSFIFLQNYLTHAGVLVSELLTSITKNFLINIFLLLRVIPLKEHQVFLVIVVLKLHMYLYKTEIWPFFFLTHFINVCLFQHVSWMFLFNVNSFCWNSGVAFTL